MTTTPQHERHDGVIYTDEQQAAIFAEGTSVALAAGAGCGKTFVLTERFLRELEPERGDVDLQRLVAITFTERAAREMRDRVREQCAARLGSAKDAATQTHWQRILRELDGARISTIHAFCTSLLRTCAVEAGLDPRFVVADQAKADTLRRDVVNNLLRHRLAAQDEAVLDLVFHFSLDGLRDRIGELLADTSTAGFAAWEDCSPEALVAHWETFHREQLRPILISRLLDSAPVQAMIALLQNETDWPPKTAERRAVLLDLLPSLADSANIEGDLDDINDAAKVQGGDAKKSWPSEDLYNAFKDAASPLRAEIKKLLPKLAFDPEKAQIAAQVCLHLLSVVHDVFDAYEAAKRDAQLLDFNDLIAKATEVITEPEHEALRAAVGQQIGLLMVDEFQDTDRVQDQLIRALCREGFTDGKLFVVGDFKQSIYRFRGAKPQVFSQLEDDLPDGANLSLTENFRSNQRILAFVNTLFASAMGADYQPLRSSRPAASEAPVIEFLWEKPEERKRDAGATRRGREAEAESIARRIRQILDTGEPQAWDKAAKHYRRVERRDIAILFRSLSDVAIYEEALRSLGIDYYLVGGHAFYSQQEIFDLLNLLRCVASSCDVVSLAGTLRSPFFSLADETIFWLAQHESGLHEGLMAESYPDQIQGSQRERAAFAAATIGKMRAMKDRALIVELIDFALEETGYDALLLAEFLGHRKLANLEKIIAQARTYQSSRRFSLEGFISQLSEFVSRQPKEALAATLGESMDVVRLMTIHQAKGLEFPVVFVPDINRSPPGSTKTAALHPELGPVTKLRENKPGSETISGFELFAEIERSEEDEERLRLFYVAVTRAADHLVLSSSLLADNERSRWIKLLEEHFDLDTGESTSESGGELDLVTRVTSDALSTAEKSRRQRGAKLQTLIDTMTSAISAGERPLPALVPPITDRGAEVLELSFSRLANVDDDYQHDIDETDGRPLRSEALELGTLVHAVLATDAISLGAPPTRDQTEALVAVIAERQEVESPDVRHRAVQMVESFFASPAAANLARADEVLPEVEFLLQWPPNPSNDEDSVLIRGFIDLLYRIEDQWYLLDYKTNAITAAQVTQTAEKYRLQMMGYATAVEQALGIAPANMVLSFLAPGVEHTFDWNADAKQSARDLIDHAIATYRAHNAAAHEQPV